MRHERAGTTHDPEYKEAAYAFYHKHVNRVDPWPAELLEAVAIGAKLGRVYEVM